MSNLSTYVACALAAVLVMDRASILPTPRAALGLPTPDEIADPGTAINRALKGDRWAPPPRREFRPADAPLEVVDFPTGSTRKRDSVAPPSSSMNNVTAIAKRPSPVLDGPAIQQKLPSGCESAFGRLAAPPLAQVPGRCII